MIFSAQLFFPPWVIFLGKYLNYKSLRLKEHMYFIMEAVSTSTESHNGDDATLDGSNGMQKKEAVHEREIKGISTLKTMLVPQHDRGFSLRRYWR
jgi:hypothetical protein